MSTPKNSRVRVELREEGSAPVHVEVVQVEGCALAVRATGPDALRELRSFCAARLEASDRDMDLGACHFAPHPAQPRRRRSDPPPPAGEGLLLFHDRIYDFRQLLRSQRVVDVHNKINQLPLLWRRKQGVTRAFRDYTLDLLYDLQVYRSVFDEIDRDLAQASPLIKLQAHEVAVAQHYPDFAAFLDDKLGQLGERVAPFSRSEHELHGFFFRKQLWDIILCSRIMARCNLKPRGYAGDSVMMQMLYDDAFEGDSIFGAFMHRHPVQHPGAQAVRNRRGAIRKKIQRLLAERPGQTLRVLSVACGPAWELRDLLRQSQDLQRLELVFLDQDRQALDEARSGIASIERDLGGRVQARYLRGSVRTLQRTLRQEPDLGAFDFIYSMGLFDYLTPPVARRVLSQLAQICAPGGQVFVGNFHPRNPSRVYMEYWLDWVLYYRDESEMLDLAAELLGFDASVESEPSGSQIFLFLRKHD